MLNISVSHVVLERSSVVPIVGELVAGRVPEHVGMNWEWELCGFPSPGDRFQESCRRCGTAALSDKNVSRVPVFAT